MAMELNKSAARESVESHAVQQTSPPAPPSTVDFPEGGLRAYLTVAGAFSCLLCSFGWINTGAVFQNYYQKELLATFSPSTIAWIPSLQAFFLLFSGPFVGRLFDQYGPTVPIVLGTFLHVFGLMMLSLATRYYQFLLTHGVCSAIGCALVFYPGTSSVATWFLKRRGAAMGVVASGASIGGVILPIVLFRLIEEVGFPWAIRICAFIILILLVFAIGSVSSRVRPSRRPLEMDAFAAPFRSVSFRLLAAAFFFFLWGMFVPFTFIVQAGTAIGISENLSNYLVPILNAASIFGRIVPNIAADSLGHFNVMIIMSLFTAIFDLAIWIPGDSAGALITYTVLLGFSTGAAISLTPVLCARVSKLKDIGITTGMAYACASFASLTAPPIAGAILKASSGSFKGVAAFSGAATVVGTVLYLATRLTIDRRSPRV